MKARVLAGTPPATAAERSNTRGSCTRRRSQSLDGGSAADTELSALATQGRPDSAPTRLQLAGAESTPPAASLQNLREDALARCASPFGAAIEQP